MGWGEIIILSIVPIILIIASIDQIFFDKHQIDIDE